MSQTEYTVSDASKLIAERDLPVLIVDTCAILDIVRVLTRVKRHTRAERLLESVSDILSMASNGQPNLSLVIPPLVSSEWKENQSKTSKEVETHLSKIDSIVQVFNVAAIFFNKTQPLITYSNLKLHEELLNLSKKVLYTGIWLKSEENVQQRATDRAILYTPPARKGAIKDCVIYEHSLELIRTLRVSNFSQKCAFLTSNIKDFCDENGSNPQEPIKSELDKVSADLITNWEWAYSLLK